ncbi:hypothetical protein L0F63_002709 [Massospora cicadina]|nr:hypothetical protein L0F63_002709 [Massospora cicadina]
MAIWGQFTGVSGPAGLVHRGENFGTLPYVAVAVLIELPVSMEPTSTGPGIYASINLERRSGWKVKRLSSGKGGVRCSHALHPLLTFIRFEGENSRTGAQSDLQGSPGHLELTVSPSPLRVPAKRLFEGIVSAGRRLGDADPMRKASPHTDKGGVRNGAVASDTWSASLVNQRIVFAGIIFKSIETEALAVLKLETLRGFSTFLHERGFLFLKHFQTLSGLFVKEIGRLQVGAGMSKGRETALNLRLAIHGVASLCLRGGTKLDLNSVSCLFDACLKVAETPPLLSHVNKAKLLKGTLRAMQVILKEDRRAYSGDLKGLLGVAMKHAQLQYSCHSRGSDGPSRGARGSVAYTEASSTSERYLCSDSDVEPHEPRQAKLARTLALMVAVRCGAIQLLQTVIEVLCLRKFSYVASATGTTPHPMGERVAAGQLPVGPIPRSDSSERSFPRCTAQSAWGSVGAPRHLSEIHRGGGLQVSLCNAVDQTGRDLGKSAFTSFSDKLGAVLHQTSLGICQAISNEETEVGRLALFKAAELDGEALGMLFFQSALYHINAHKDSEVRCAAWSICRVLLESDLKEETKGQLLETRCSLDGNFYPLQRCAWEVFESDRLDDALRAEAAHFLVAAIRNRREPWAKCAKLAGRHLHDPSCRVRASVLRMGFEFGVRLQLSGEVNSQAEVWTCIIDDYLGQSTADKASQVREIICDGLGGMPSEVFGQLNTRRRLFCITLLLGYADDEDAAVRASSFRALGQFAAFASLAEDQQFLNDATALAIDNLAHPSLDVKARASWCLANICDLVGRSKFQLDDTMFFKAVDAGLASCQSHDKLKWNGARILGGLLRCAPSELVASDSAWLGEVAKAILSNIKAGPLKGRWNACYAVKSIHENPSFPPHPIPDWYAPLVLELLAALKHKNFKLRTASLAALAGLKASAPHLSEVLKTVAASVERLPAVKAGCDYQELGLVQLYEGQLLKTHAALHAMLSDGAGRDPLEVDARVGG